MKSETKIYILILLAIVLSIYSHSMVWEKYIMPTYGNANIHVASIRHTIEHQHYPIVDYSYGGGIANLYVPAYRFVIAELCVLTGSSIDFMSRAIVMLFAFLLPIGFFLLARKIWDEKAGIFAAFFVSIVPELFPYTVRPLPQSLGMVLLPIVFYSIISEHKTALWLAFFVALVHQEAAVFLAFVAGGYVAGYLLLKSITYLFNYKIESDKIVYLSFLVGAIVSISYLGWHYIMMGNIDITTLSQFKYHEGNIISFMEMFKQSGNVVGVLGSIGVVVLLYKIIEKLVRKKIESKMLFGVVLVVIGLAFVKNDVVGIKVFMDRFLVYLQEGLIASSGIGGAAIWELLKKLGGK